MAGRSEGHGPSYISSHSADVILSDIRPTKLQLDALRAVNVLLDEFLYNILNASRSLSTDKLRAALLKVLPTSLGKEALLEAEVELRAYWDRTSPSGSGHAGGDDQGKNFHLQWAFELLRLKCEAYSTLNESDEEPEAETRLHFRMGQSTGLSPPKASLVAPASLYLTAILEALCEHILSNVGRVAARDSSRTSATVEDLFVALCEDESIYGLFKSMKVYEQIEALSILPKPRRSKSLSRDKPNVPQRASTPTPKDSTSRLRMSSDSSVAMTTTTIPTHNRRSSLDKARAMKMFIANNRTSLERASDSGEGQNIHKKSDSVLSEAYSAYDEGERSFEDAALLEEFDNLMRSDSTLKVSLTPDRLKSMDVFNKEKGQRGARRPPPKIDLSASSSETDVPVMPPTAASRVNGRSLHQNVDPIVEDEEVNTAKPQSSAVRSQQASVTSPITPASSGGRLRSVSASNPSPTHNSSGQQSRTNGGFPFPSPPLTALSSQKHRSAVEAPSSFPRTRRVTHNRESLDLDDVMAGSDNEETEVVKLPEAPPKRSRPIRHAVSANTQDLIDFLAEGPPDEPVSSNPPVSKSGLNLMDASKANPSRSSLETTKSKAGSGRLQWMMAKLSMGSSSEKLRNSSGDIPRRVHTTTPPTSIRPSLPFKRSIGNLSPNRPIPPRPPPLISPPLISPPSSSQESMTAPVKSLSPGMRPPMVIPTREEKSTPEPPTRTPAPITRSQTNGHMHSRPVSVDAVPANGHVGHISPKEVASATKPCPSTTITEVDPNPEKILPPALPRPPAGLPTSKKISTKLAAETAQSPSSSQLSADDALVMHRLFSRATTADECRVIFDMFLARSGLHLVDFPYPSPSPSDNSRKLPSVTDVELEHSLVELLLSGNDAAPPRKRRRKAVPALDDLPGVSTHTSASNGDTTTMIRKDTPSATNSQSSV